MDTNNPPPKFGDGRTPALDCLTVACDAPDVAVCAPGSPGNDAPARGLAKSSAGSASLQRSASPSACGKVEPSSDADGLSNASTGNEAASLPPCATCAPAPTLLLVDDEENILAALRRVLRREGYRVLTAGSGEFGLGLLAANDVDVIISDQRMPGMTGVEFLRRARALRPNAVRMVLSGYSELQSMADAINEGAIYRFLSKPWDDEKLLGQIRGAFEHKTMVDANQRLQRDLIAANAAMASANAVLKLLLDEQQARGDRSDVSLEVMHEMLEYAPTPIVGIDDEGLVVLANAQAERLFGDGLPILGTDASERLPSRVLDAAADNQTGGEIELAGLRYAVVIHEMGTCSASRGRLLVLTPVVATPIASRG